MEIGVRLRVQIDDRVSERLESLAGRELSDARRRLVEQSTQQALVNTLQLNPVDTGRSRAAWAAALQQAGGEAPADWRGPHPQGAAIAEGAARGSFTRSDGESTTLLSAENNVSYVGFLEYGTRRMAPFAMVRRALLAVQQQLARWFEFPAG
jgi:hypothetical protein